MSAFGLMEYITIYIYIFNSLLCTPLLYILALLVNKFKFFLFILVFIIFYLYSLPLLFILKSGNPLFSLHCIWFTVSSCITFHQLKVWSQLIIYTLINLYYHRVFSDTSLGATFYAHLHSAYRFLPTPVQYSHGSPLTLLAASLPVRSYNFTHSNKLHFYKPPSTPLTPGVRTHRN